MVISHITLLYTFFCTPLCRLSESVTSIYMMVTLNILWVNYTIHICGLPFAFDSWSKPLRCYHVGFVTFSLELEVMLSWEELLDRSPGLICRCEWQFAYTVNRDRCLCLRISLCCSNLLYIYTIIYWTNVTVGKWK